mgnify:CR=1 FL=1
MRNPLPGVQCPDMDINPMARKQLTNNSKKHGEEYVGEEWSDKKYNNKGADGS